jgi:hypothetical protein
MIVLFALSLVAMWRVEAEAACSCIKYFGGSCLTNCGTVVPKGLLSTLSGKATGSDKDKTLEVVAEGVCSTVSDSAGECVGGMREPVTGLLACRNRGRNFAVGANPDLSSIEGATGLGGEIDKNGNFKNVSVISMPTPTALAGLDDDCHDLGGGLTWKAHDVAFCDSAGEPLSSFEVVGRILLSDNTSDGQLRLVCTRPCEDILFNTNTGFFSGPPYTCEVCPLTADGQAWDCKSCALAGGSIDCEPFVK